MQGKQLSAAHQTPSPAVRLANDGHLSCPCVHLADTHGSISCLELYQENVAVSRPTQPSDHGSDKFELCWYNSCVGDYDLCNVSAGGHCICHRHSSCPGRLLGLPQPALSPVAGGGHRWLLLVRPPDADWAVWGRSGQPLGCGRLPRLPGLDLLPRSVFFPAPFDCPYGSNFLYQQYHSYEQLWDPSLLSDLMWL